MESLAPVIAFSDRRWDALSEHARRALSKLARTRSVFFLEGAEPVETGDREFWELKCGAPDLLVCRPRMFARRGTPPERMTRALLRWLDIEEFVALPSFILHRGVHAWPSILRDPENEQ